MMSVDRLTEQQRPMFTYDQFVNGYGLGMRTPRLDPTWTEFGWGGAAGAFASVDPVNNITIYYAQHVLGSPVMPLRTWIYRCVRADLLGQTIQVPGMPEEYDPSITY